MATDQSARSATDVTVRRAEERDLARLTEIYNHYVRETPITFDLEPYTGETRRAWFDKFSQRGPHRLFVAEQDGLVLGYAGTTGFRDRRAYDTTVETTIYCAPDATGRGSRYAALRRALRCPPRRRHPQRNRRHHIAQRRFDRDP